MYRKPMIDDDEKKTTKEKTNEIKFSVRFHSSDFKPMRVFELNIRFKSAATHNKIDLSPSICAVQNFNSLVWRIYVWIPSGNNERCIPMSIECWIIPQFVRLKQWNSKIISTRREKLKIHQVNAWRNGWFYNIQVYSCAACNYKWIESGEILSSIFGVKHLRLRRIFTLSKSPTSLITYTQNLQHRQSLLEANQLKFACQDWILSRVWAQNLMHGQPTWTFPAMISPAFGRVQSFYWLIHVRMTFRSTPSNECRHVRRTEHPLQMHWQQLRL